MHPLTEHSFLHPQWSLPDNVRIILSTRQGGCSEGVYAGFNVAEHVGDEASSVAGNRGLLEDANSPAVAWQWLNQVHGTRVESISTAQPPIEADGLHTSEPNLALCVMTADCLPVFLVAEHGNRATEVAVVHAGWRGLAEGVIEAGVGRFAAAPQAISAYLGPAIGACHFEVGQDVLQAFQNGRSEPDLARYFQALPAPGKYLADLYGLARLRLNDLGIDRVVGGEHCTYCDSDNFYSFRRDGDCGRMVSAIYLAAD